MTRLGTRFAGLLCLLVAATAGAQIPPAGETLAGFDPWPDAPSGWRWQSLPAAAEATPSDAAIRRMAAEAGADWHVLRHPWFGTPSLIVTTGIDLGIARLDEGDATVALLRRFVHRHRELFGIDRLEDLALHRVSLTPNAAGHAILGVDFKQTYRGFDVWTPTEPIRVKLRADATLGRLTLVGWLCSSGRNLGRGRGGRVWRRGVERQEG